MSQEISPERLTLVGDALQGLLGSNAYGMRFANDPVQIDFYARTAVELADATMNKMNPKIPIVPPTPVVPEPKELTENGITVG